MSKSKADEKKLEKLLDKAVKLMGNLNGLEITFSRIKNESEELLRKLLKRNGEDSR